MSKLATLSALTLATVVSVGCNDSSELLSPEPLLTSSFAPATVTSFTITYSISSLIDPGVSTFSADGKVLHIRGQTSFGIIAGDLGLGSAVTVFDFDGDAATFVGSGRGTITISLPGGTYEGRFAGTTNGDVFSNHFQAHGTGAFAGMKIQGAATDEADPVNDVFILTGQHVDPRP